MPRLPPSLFWRARHAISPMAARLLPACRDLQSAANELRWIREHVRDTKSPLPAGLRVWDLVERRGRGVPLQYVLGTQPFGDLEIKCRPGVLIPRPETEAYTLHLASILARDQPLPSSLSILDLCTGTGCIALLLLHTLLQSLPSAAPIAVHGIDISPAAIRLARANHRHNSAALNHSPSAPSPSTRHNLTFTQHDIFAPSLIPHLRALHSLPTPTPDQNQNQNPRKEPDLDLLVSNPPYISRASFARSTARAVRNHEPRLALVPGLGPPHHHHHHHRQDINTTAATSITTSNNSSSSSTSNRNCRPEDVFYARLLALARELRPRRVLMEVGGWAQAERVVGLFLEDLKDVRGGGYETVEVWRDEPSAGDRGERVEVGGRRVVVRGEGLGRAVYLSRVGF